MIMSAAELIRQVAALPPEEKAVFIKMVHKMENGSQKHVPTNGQEWPDFSQRLRQIYGNKFAPDSQSVIDEGRGDR
jgi:hypothetical protein